jgi:hypothetical protein
MQQILGILNNIIKTLSFSKNKIYFNYEIFA